MNKKQYIFSLIVFIFFNWSYSQLEEYTDNTSFVPESGKYVISGWVKEIHSTQQQTYSSNIKVDVTGITSVYSLNIYPTGNIIDGWQRMIGVIDIPPLSGAINPKLEISLNCSNSSGNDCFYDDIRIYPYNGNMKSFVYDEDTQRLMAELDENNYATFYEYDLEGGLVRVKKETERGVYTIQETRSNNPKKDE